MPTKKGTKRATHGHGTIAPFHAEQAYLRSHQDELLALYENKFITIHGNDVVGPFENDADAYSAGLAQFGNVPFLIHRVARETPVEHFPALALGLIDASS